MPLTTYTAGEVLTAASLNANFSFAAGGAPMALFREEQAAGTYAGTATTGAWATRVLNTTVTNGITGCSLASSQVTLPAGTYYVYGITPAYGGTGGTQCRLYNITDSAAIGYGLNCPNGNVGSGVFSELDYYFTLAASKVIELQMRVQYSVATDGLGTRTNWGNVEVYSELTITKVA